jgi:hypothetical protein
VAVYGAQVVTYKSKVYSLSKYSLLVLTNNIVFSIIFDHLVPPIDESPEVLVPLAEKEGQFEECFPVVPRCCQDIGLQHVVNCDRSHESRWTSRFRGSIDPFARLPARKETTSGIALF